MHHPQATISNIERGQEQEQEQTANTFSAAAAPPYAASQLNSLNVSLYPVAREEEFQLCPNCKVGRLRPTGLAATSADPDTNRLTGDSYYEYKCHSCDYPKAAKPK